MALVGSGWSPLPAVAGDFTGWLSGYGGYESDILVNPNLDPYTVPGGSFLQADGGIGWLHPFTGGSHAGLWGQFSVQRFGNDEGRTLTAGSCEADGVWRIARHWRLRGAVGGSYFDDSVQETAQRTGAGTDLSLAYLYRGLRLELAGGWQHTRYPHLERPDAAGTWGTYSESNAFIAPALLAAIGGSAVVRAEVTAGWTDARDPLYDASQRKGRVSLWWRLGTGFWLIADGQAQRREFSERDPAENSDSYAQIGLGLEKSLSARVAATVRYTFSRYRYVLGGEDDTYRIACGVTWRFGGDRSERATLADGVTAEAAPPQIPRAGRPWRFRLHAPGAARVALVGDFNNWDPLAQPLRPVGDGWWETELTLPAGSYQYAYWVDGVLRAPPNAQPSVDDGFGGRNGLHDVVP